MNAPARVPLAEVSDLMAPGQPLPFRVLDGLGRLLLGQGQRIHDVRQLQTLLERGACVEYEDVKQVRAAHAAAASGGGRAPSGRELNWFDRFDQLIWALDDLLRALVKGEDRQGIEEGNLAAQLAAFGDAFIARVEAHPDAALFLVVRQDDKRHALYSITHALHAAVVVLLAARQLAWTAEQVRSVVLATLTMNAAIVDLQSRMAEQKESPTKSQLDQIRAHPHRAADLLAAAGVTDAAWLEAVRDHHERTSGGYPRGDFEPGEGARLVRAADVYTAKISPRVLRAAQSPQAAARQLFQEQGGGPMAAALIKAVGVYPPGDLVTLKNGETAIVAMRTAVGNAPQVAVLFNAQGKTVPGAPRRETAAQSETAIVGALADRSRINRVLPETVYGLLK